ncbi:MAG: multicopper oxidase domain-containing protein [Sphingomonadales bacterium]|nr:multicopper oxidase domain-containing protein [Sphingomonadales bacterium]
MAARGISAARVIAAKLAASGLAAALACWSGAALAKPVDDCQAIAARFRTGAVQNYRPLPALTPRQGTLGMDLVARNADVTIGDKLVVGVPVFAIQPRAETRPVRITGPNGHAIPFPARCLADSAWSYGGTRWELMQGDAIAATLSSELDNGNSPSKPEGAANGGVPCNDTNLHVHGLLVMPTRPPVTSGNYGDYVFVTATGKPAAAPSEDACDGPVPMPHGPESLARVNYRIAIPGHRLPDGDSLSENPYDMRSGHHPSGLFIYHPHPHGYSRAQLHGATTGLLTVGRLTDYVRVAAAPGTPRPKGFDIRYLLLKDAPVERNTGDANWHMLANGKFLDQNGNAVPCIAAGGAPRGECQSADGSKHWLFTVNGVQYPVITDVKPGEAEIWRIANVSPNVTYDLQLRYAVSAGSLGADYRFRVLSLDGVSDADRAGGAPVEMRDHLVMMPASRAEIFIPPLPQGARLVLATKGVDTGGDVWPEVRLAELHMPPSQHRYQLQTRSMPGSALPTAVAAATVALDPCTPTDPAAGPIQRRIHFVKRTVGQLEILGLVAAARQPDGQWKVWSGSQWIGEEDAWNAIAASPIDDGRKVVPAPAFGSGLNYGAVCARKGQKEIWTLDNWTNEDHNFHIHQSKFRVLETVAAAMPAKASGASPDLRELVLRDRPLTESGALRYHDTIPVLRGAPVGAGECNGSINGAVCTPTAVRIEIAFDRDEQVGHFVYHCHILEHEDLGMMAAIDVCAPGQPCAPGGMPGHMAMHH